MTAILDLPDRLPPARNVQRAASITPDELYRYSLTRSWDPDPWVVERHRPVVFVGLNPSTADGKVDDPTIRRCVDFTRRWGRCHLTMINLFAYRATDPTELVDARGAGIDVVGPLNDPVIIAAAAGASAVVAAWGSHRFAARRAEIALTLIDPERGSPLSGTPVMCLGRNADGQPKHPLYLGRNTALEVLRA